jgi:hypothetical protein
MRTYSLFTELSTLNTGVSGASSALQSSLFSRFTFRCFLLFCEQSQRANANGKKNGKKQDCEAQRRASTRGGAFLLTLRRVILCFFNV